jgi:16S rRNA (guanine527-N7)-methyltransferase
MDYWEYEKHFQEFPGYSIEKFQLLIKHLQLIQTANQTTNITSITNLEQSIMLHAYDSLLGTLFVNLEEDECFIDIGSGAGFPGIPFAIFSERKGTLLDSIAKKAQLLKLFVMDLGLSNILTVQALRAETFALEQPSEYSLVLVRAVGSLVTLMELASPLLRTGGILLAYKGPNALEEIEEAKQIQTLLGMRIKKIEQRTIPIEEASRILVIIEKATEPQLELPRAIGKAQNKPLHIDT